MISVLKNAIAKPVAFFLLLISPVFFYCEAIGQTQLAKWETLVLDFEGPLTSETSTPNPFTDYRLTVTFSNGDRSIAVPGYFAADGEAADTGATEGNVWRCHFVPDLEGKWAYEAELRSDKGIAVNDEPNSGEVVGISNAQGEFEVGPISNADSKDFRSFGKIIVEGSYFRFQESSKVWIKGGADSPENLLAYAGFDGTRRVSGEGSDGEATAGGDLHRFQPHVEDWRPGDPVWKDGQGKGIIGGINYLSDSGVNAMYFLTLNINGDGKDVWPFVDENQFDRFDVSKLDQWEIVFRHMQHKGILMHVVTQETENERLLDDGETGPLRKLYYRELVARFGHHLALVWNLGEENGPAHFSPNGQTTAQQSAMAAYLKRIDPWQHPVFIHTHSTEKEKDEILDPLLGDPSIDGLSFQVNEPKLVHQEVLRWRQKSITAGKRWAITMDEIGPWHTGTVPDVDDPDHAGLQREVLWGSLLAGAGGVEWYFGAKYPGNDLSLEDWRSRDEMWAITKHATDFLAALPVNQMEPSDHLITGQSCYCLGQRGEVYIAYVPVGEETVELNLESFSDSFNVEWFDPATGKVWSPDNGAALSIKGPGLKALKKPPVGKAEVTKDWVALIRKQ